MSFIKVETVLHNNMTSRNGTLFYQHDGSVILNTSHIVSVELTQPEANLTDDSKKFCESLFDVPASKLCILKVYVSPKDYYPVIAPLEKFKDFK